MKCKQIMLIPLLFSTAAFAKMDVSSLFVQISDVMSEIKKGEITKSKQNLATLEQDFLKIKQHNSTAGINVKSAIKKAIETPNTENLEALSKNLYAFEKEQNPVDYAKKHKDFIEKMTPLYAKLNAEMKTKDLGKIIKAARNFGRNWRKEELTVREISIKHYAKFERTLYLMRLTAKSDKPDMDKIEKKVAELGEIMTDFTQFKVK